MFIEQNIKYLLTDFALYFLKDSLIKNPVNFNGYHFNCISYIKNS